MPGFTHQGRAGLVCSDTRTNGQKIRILTVYMKKILRAFQVPQVRRLSET